MKKSRKTNNKSTQKVKVKSKNTTIPDQTFLLEDIEDVKGWKAIGTKITMHKVNQITLVESIGEELPAESEEEIVEEEIKETTKENPPTTFTSGNTVDLEVTPKKTHLKNDQLGLF